MILDRSSERIIGERCMAIAGARLYCFVIVVWRSGVDRCQAPDTQLWYLARASLMRYSQSYPIQLRAFPRPLTL